MDTLQLYHDYATKVANALNTAGVVPPEERGIDIATGVMVIVAKSLKGKPPTEEPIGGAINYNNKTKLWELQEDIQQAERLADEPDKA